MKKERLEELLKACYVTSGEGRGYRVNRLEDWAVKDALLAVERETVERCAKVCQEHGDMVGNLGIAATDTGTKDMNFARARACYVNRDAIRSLLTEE